jgi:hypothetical protein
MTAFVANTNLLTLVGLKDHITDAFISTATVTVTVKDQNGSPVSGMTWPATMSYVAASDGNYRLALEDDLALIAKRNYTAFIEVDAGAARIGHWEFRFKPETRVDE